MTGSAGSAVDVGSRNLYKNGRRSRRRGHRGLAGAEAGGCSPGPVRMSMSPSKSDGVWQLWHLKTWSNASQNLANTKLTLFKIFGKCSRAFCTLRFKTKCVSGSCARVSHLSFW